MNGYHITNGHEVFPSFNVKKRRFDDNEEMPSTDYVFCKGKNYLSISGEAGVFQTEAWTEGDQCVFVPVREDVSIRVQSYDQFTFPQSIGSHFIGDSNAQYMGTVYGRVVHMWRYNDKERRLFISRTVLFPTSLVSAYEDMKRLIESFY